MHKRPLGWILTGLVTAGLTALVAPGCSRSIASEYQKLCVATCEAGDDCEGYGAFLPVDREDCINKCPDDAIDYEKQVNDQCDNGVDIDGAQVDKCDEAVTRLGASCRADDESEINEAIIDIGQECQQTDLYSCR